MDLFELLNALSFVELTADLRSGLELFWKYAGKILSGSGVTLAEPSEKYYQLSQNFFSAMFLLSFQRAGIAPEKRARYVAMNQCLRGMVTGCDNILDDEYKLTLDTDIPGTRFRSIVDIMVADRVMFDLLLDLHATQGVALEKIRQAHAASLTALTRSGMQEATEEAGIHTFLEPSRILEEVHHLKTGVLFQSVWAVPLVLEPELAPAAKPLSEALYRIGMGCQILDDMTDLKLDISMHRHNYLASLIVHTAPHTSAAQMDLTTVANVQDLLAKHPQARAEASRKAREYLESGLKALFGSQGEAVVRPARVFLAERIGATQLLSSEYFQ